MPLAGSSQLPARTLGTPAPVQRSRGAGELKERFCMPLFYFILKGCGESVPDREGSEFPDNATAHSYANTVARELMRNREPATRFWRLQVCDDDLRPVSEVHFATIDDALCHFSPEHQNTIQRMSRTIGTLSDAICDVRATLSQIQLTIARANDSLLTSPLTSD